MLSLSVIRVDDSGWTSVPGDASTRQNQAGDLFSLHFFPIPPDIPCPLSDLGPLRKMHRESLSGHGAVVEVEPDELDGLPALRTIIKVAQKPNGMTYVGAFTVPFRDSSFVLKYQCPERGMTGIREAVVIQELDLLKNPALLEKGWFRDPYDPTFETRPLRTRADDDEWDAHFPDHPLSRVRKYLGDARRTTFGAEARSESPFEGPRGGVFRRLRDKLKPRS